MRLSFVAAGAALSVCVALTTGSAAAAATAAATTPYRPGTRLGHLTASSSAAGSASAQTGPTVMAGVVGLLAFLAVVFLVVTFIRRRTAAA
jgi:hypothetical protein